MELAFSLLSFEKIFKLPLIVNGPGLVLITLFLLRAIRSFISLRLIQTVTSLIYAFVITLILSQGGNALVQLMGIEEDPKAEDASQTLITPTSPSVFQYNV